jgi:hypothetical protein
MERKKIPALVCLRYDGSLLAAASLSYQQANVVLITTGQGSVMTDQHHAVNQCAEFHQLVNAMPLLDWSSYQYVVRITVLRSSPGRVQTPESALQLIVAKHQTPPSLDMPSGTVPLQIAGPEPQQQQQQQHQSQHQQHEH